MAGEKPKLKKGNIDKTITFKSNRLIFKVDSKMGFIWFNRMKTK